MSIKNPAFREKEAAEVVHYFLSLAGGELDIYNVVKYVYLANRKSLFTLHSSITNDSFASLPFGPVPSQTYDRLNSYEKCSEYWKNLIAPRDGNTIRRNIPEFEYEALSKIERELMNSIYSEYREFTFDQLKEETHSFPEWTDPGKSSLPISLEELFEKNNLPEGNFKAMAEYSSLQNAMEHFKNAS